MSDADGPGAAATDFVDVTADLRAPRPRIVVRHRDTDGRLTDAVGVLLAGPRGARERGDRRVLPDDGPPVTIPAADVAAVRVVPAKRVRPVSSPTALERLAARGWPGTEQARLGGWLLRAGGGWTGRANSALAVGDPGMPADDALAATRDWYHRRGLPARLHLPLPMGDVPSLEDADGPGEGGEDGGLRALAALTAARGWTAHDDTLVLVADLRRGAGSVAAEPGPGSEGNTSSGWDSGSNSGWGPTSGSGSGSGTTFIGGDGPASAPGRPGVADRPPRHGAGEVAGSTAPEPADLVGGVEAAWADEPTPEWLGLNRGGASASDPAAAAVLGAVPAHYLTLRRDGRPVAVGRVVVTDDWCGVGGVEVAPGARRGGLGRAVTELLLERGRADGARFAYLQTLRSNAAALALYARLGFEVHHGYHYRREPTR